VLPKPPAGAHAIPRTRDRSWAYAAGVVAIVALVIAVFWQTRAFGVLNFDDDQYLDAVVLQGLTWNGFTRAWTEGHVGNWHPLTTLSFMLDAELFGEWWGGYHLHNVVLHASASAVLFLAIARLTGRIGTSFVSAALFAIHPLRAESVAWITERKDVLSGLFLATTLLAYAWYVAKPASRGRYGILLVSFTAGLLSKSMLVTLPVAFLILDWWPLRRWDFDRDNPRAGLRRLRPLIIEKLPMFALSGLSAIATVLSVGDVVRPISTLPFTVRAASSVVAYATYVVQLMRPFGLAPHYPYSSIGPTATQVVVSAAFVAVMTAAAWFLRKRWPSFTTGWAWFLVTLLPVIGFVPSGIQLIADRYTYVSQIWLVVAVVQGAATVTERFRVPPMALRAATTVGVLGLALGGYLQASVWRDSETLWRYTLSVTKDNAYAHANLGSVLMTKGEPVEAADQARRALAIESHNIIALANLGTLLLDRGRADEAIRLYERTVEVNPKFVLGWFFLGNAFQRAGRFNDAERAWRKAVEIDPGMAAAWSNLALLLIDLREPEGALEAAERAVDAGGGAPAQTALERAREAMGH
jgi:Tfp pilus assembly protein PilF